jgi:predicted metal-dependent HD superfamily phosphohydrolase
MSQITLLDEELGGTNLITDLDTAAIVLGVPLTLLLDTTILIDHRLPIMMLCGLINYGEPLQRYYHGPRHVGRMWREFDRLDIRPDIEVDNYNQIMLRYAVAQFALFHDTVMIKHGDPGRNEYESVRIYHRCTRARTESVLVAQAIMATANHLQYTPWLIHEIKLMLDLDLAEIGTDRYHVNTELLYLESGMPSTVFDAGRLKFLQAMMRREKIYYTKYFQDREEQARDNMSDDIKNLTRKMEADLSYAEHSLVGLS